MDEEAEETVNMEYSSAASTINIPLIAVDGPDAGDIEDASMIEKD